MHRFSSIGCALFLLIAAVAHAQTSNVIAQESVLIYLDQVTQWQREAVAIEPTTINARESVFRDSLRDNSTKTLQSSFLFMRSVASNEPARQTIDPESTRQKVTQRAAATAEHIRQLKAQLTNGSGSRAALHDELLLEQARLQLIETILANLNAASNRSPNKLIYTIDSLSRSIPELNPDMPSPSSSKPTTTKRTGTGILGISANLFELTRKIRELDAAIDTTTQLKKQSMELMKALRNGLGEPATAEEAEIDENDAPQLVLPISDRVLAYQRIGATIIPLGESMRWMDASKQTLKEWREVLDQQRAGLLGHLGVRLGMVLFALAVTYFISEVIRRGLKKIRDAKRKRQLNTIRRIGTGIAYLFILLLNFISDFGSFVTFAGFLTAGLAVALQSLLLSLVAHFLFYGRYGVRNGDRVHVAGVTGDIVQIGMVRFYLRELRETEEGFVPTGKTVAFPNSIIFQSAAFYKYTN